MNTTPDPAATVQRHSPTRRSEMSLIGGVTVTMEPNDNGKWVRHSDYAALQAKAAEDEHSLSNIRFELAMLEQIRLKDNKYLLDQRDQALAKLAAAEAERDEALSNEHTMSRELDSLRCKRCQGTGIVSLGHGEGEDYCESCPIGREMSRDIELRECEQLGDRLSDLLTRTAAALKGPPEPLTMHDWSDLPKVAMECLTRTERAEKLLGEALACVPSNDHPDSSVYIDDLRDRISAHLAASRGRG